MTRRCNWVVDHASAEGSSAASGFAPAAGHSGSETSDAIVTWMHAFPSAKDPVSRTIQVWPRNPPESESSSPRGSATGGGSADASIPSGTTWPARPAVSGMKKMSDLNDPRLGGTGTIVAGRIRPVGSSPSRTCSSTPVASLFTKPNVTSTKVVSAVPLVHPQQNSIGIAGSIGS